MDVSIIIPAYNSERLIGDTLRSIVVPEGVTAEILVVDDGSKDRTAEVAAAAHPLVRVIARANGGIGAARNTGLAEARGRFIAFSDHDDIWHPRKLATQVAVFDLDPGLGVVYGEFTSWQSDQPATFATADLDATLFDARLSGWIYPELLLTNWVLLSTAIFRREVFDRIGLFNPALPPADDWDLAVRASRHYRFAKLAQPVALYRQHVGQTSRLPAARDIQSEVRQSFIDEFGLAGPDGRQADTEALRERFFRGHFLHGHFIYRAGMYAAAEASFRKAWGLRRMNFVAAAYWLLSAVRARTTAGSPR